MDSKLSGVIGVQSIHHTGDYLATSALSSNFLSLKIIIPFIVPNPNVIPSADQAAHVIFYLFMLFYVSLIGSP